MSPNEILAMTECDVAAAMSRHAARPTRVDASGPISIVYLEGVIDRPVVDRVSEQLKAAAANPDVGSILLYVDSPGGRATGLTDLVDTVASAAAKKFLAAYVQDMAASAAYMAISPASRIIANRGALVGAIGSYLVVPDVSQMVNRAGVRFHVIRAGQFKGAGLLGTEITAEQLIEFQRVVNSINAQFLAAVQTGRRLTNEQLTAVSDGRIHIAEEARRLHLVDEIGSFEQVVAGMNRLAEKQGAKNVDAKAELDQRVAEAIENGARPEQARMKVLRDNPELRERMVDEANEDRPRMRR